MVIIKPQAHPSIDVLNTFCLIHLDEFPTPIFYEIDLGWKLGIA